MKVKELIEFLKTLNQEYEFVISDSKYGDTNLTKTDFVKNEKEKQYVV